MDFEKIDFEEIIISESDSVTPARVPTWTVTEALLHLGHSDSDSATRTRLK